MRLSRLLLLPVALLAMTACSDDDGVTVNARPPLGGVRFINAVPDGGPVDIRMIDQVQWSASSVSMSNYYGLPFRAGTIHWATEAKARHIRVFPTDSNITVTSQILHDTTITIEPNKNITLMLVGTRAANDLHFVQIDDDVPELADGQIAARVVNAGATGAVDGYFTASTSTSIAAMAPTVANVAPFSASAYVVRATDAFAAQATPAGSQASIWSFVAPAGEPAADGVAAAAGYSAEQSGLSAYVFPRACPAVALPLTVDNCVAMVGRAAASSGNAPTGVNRTAYQSPTVVWFVDRIPPVPAPE
jgi:hypothetical protein